MVLRSIQLKLFSCGLCWEESRGVIRSRHCMRKIRPRSSRGIKSFYFYFSAADHCLNHCIQGSIYMSKMILLVTLHWNNDFFYCQWIEEDLRFTVLLRSFNQKSSSIYKHKFKWACLFDTETKVAVFDHRLLIFPALSVCPFEFTCFGF